MTIGQAIDLVHIAVTGGHLTQDSNVMRADICAYLPSALNYFNVVAMRERRKELRGEDAGGSWSDGSFYGVYTLTPALDSTTNQWYIDLPGVIISLPRNRGIDGIWPVKNQTAPFIPAPSPQALAGAWGILGDNVFYYLQREGEATRVYFINANSFTCDVTVRALLTPDCMNEDDLMPCPPEVEMMVIDKCVQHFIQQRTIPADNGKDDRDINQGQPTPAG
jgi:hypothetical protein